MAINCPMCGIGPQFQKADPDGVPKKSMCKGCGTKYHDRTRN